MPDFQAQMQFVSADAEYALTASDTSDPNIIPFEAVRHPAVNKFLRALQELHKAIPDFNEAIAMTPEQEQAWIETVQEQKKSE